MVKPDTSCISQWTIENTVDYFKLNTECFFFIFFFFHFSFLSFLFQWTKSSKSESFIEFILFIYLISGYNIHVLAHICEVGQEKDEHGNWKWALPNAEPCKCTSVKLGGTNNETHMRPFKPTYVNKPLVSNEIAIIRKHYGLQCTGKDE